MSRILEAFANDNLCINPATYNGSPEYKKATQIMLETTEALSKKLSEEEKKLFEQFCNAQTDENQLYQADRFIRGYRVGVLMMIEVFTGSSDLLWDKEADVI